MAGPLQPFPFRLLENLKEKECAHQFVVDIYLICILIHINPPCCIPSISWSHIVFRNSTKIKTVLSRSIWTRSSHFALQVHVSPCKSMSVHASLFSLDFLISFHTFTLHCPHALRSMLQPFDQPSPDTARTLRTKLTKASGWKCEKKEILCRQNMKMLKRLQLYNFRMKHGFVAFSLYAYVWFCMPGLGTHPADPSLANCPCYLCCPCFGPSIPSPNLHHCNHLTGKHGSVVAVSTVAICGYTMVHSEDSRSECVTWILIAVVVVVATIAVVA